ncbi:amino acid permease [Clostridium folliculivorans]|uniref:Amino acid permease YvbW n=1 Tax=Clostridium folliculivorans TaxID=2886038 RepID=A0A9W5XYE3_9CLOT|nr:amino acid permease [Clostridium folliculivorans]GKU23209.1 putative amino acid permease YvbW [Clostridium folliculivorans]GKU29255.1 putative amino acid permease YvbW [Clostridium folliculivorans]
MDSNSSNKNIHNNEMGKHLNAYSLAGIGIGSIIGAGFFLGTSLAINQAGPSVVLAFLFGGIIMSQVLGAMTNISINRPVRGSFRVYTEEFLGRFTGFLLGWILFVSGILSVGSEAIASAVFLKYWIHEPLPILSLIVLLIVICINALGTKYFGLIESGMGLLKIIVLIFFVLIGVIFISKSGFSLAKNPFSNYSSFFPNNISGFLQSMLIVVFTYSGISAVAMATNEVRNPKKDIPKATIILTLGIVVLYVVSMFIIVSVVNWDSINVDLSPFVQSLNVMGITWASSIINLIILIATVSVMAGSFYGCTQMLVSLAEAKEAPNRFAKATKRGLYRDSWILTAIASLAVVAISFILGTKLFNYLIAASSYISFLNWVLNLLTYIVWLKKRDKKDIYKSPLIFGKVGAYTTIFVIIGLFLVSLTVKDFRMGFYSMAIVTLIICAAYRVSLDRR